MSKFSEYNKARKDLDREYGLGHVSWIEFACRSGVLGQLINEERSPCADKAAKIWDGSTAAHEYLRRKPADVIAASSDQPFRVVTVSDLIGSGWMLGLRRADDGKLYASGFNPAIPPRQTVTEMTISFDGSRASQLTIDQAVLAGFYPHRQECADAVAFSWGIRTRTVEDFQRIASERSAAQLINGCRNDLEDFNIKRQPVADAAQWLINNTTFDQEGLRSTSPLELVRVFGEASKPRKRTRITINRLGTAEGGAKVRFDFVLNGAVISSSEREGKVSSGYEFYSCVTNFDSVTVIGDCDYTIERGVSE